tara:strand:- start:1359 stop:2015 length:657 start_codon:yes stop_codon:yes gene_type:complete
MDTLNFRFVFLGQSVLKYEVPLDVYNIINHIYETKKHELPPANKQLVGKIVNEHSLFYNGNDTSKINRHSYLPQNVFQWFQKTMHHYLDWNKIKGYKTHLNSIWINEMKANEYNPVHIHQGSLYTGLSSVMVLKLPKNTGIEYSAEQKPMNGQLQIMGNSSGQFANADYGPELKERNFYVFPYDVRHCVYPFNSSTDIRRTLSCNMDVEYNPILNRSA